MQRGNSVLLRSVFSAAIVSAALRAALIEADCVKREALGNGPDPAKSILTLRRRYGS